MDKDPASTQYSSNLLDSDDGNEEDTVFDFQSENDKQIGKQIMMLFTWMSMGLLYAIPGANLLAITCNLKTTLERVGLLFVSRAVGTLFGRILSNIVIKRVKGYSIISIMLVLMPVLVAVFPLVKELAGASVLMLVIGGAYGIIAEGLNIIDITNGLRKVGQFNTGAFALSLGAGIASVMSSPFLQAFTNMDHLNETRVHMKTPLNSGMEVENQIAHSIFPGVPCPLENKFAKSFWLSTIPCYMLFFHVCYVICRKPNEPVTDTTGTSRQNGTVDWKIYGLQIVLFVSMCLYRGIYRIAELVFFTYISLGPFSISTTKACLFVMMLWVAFAFGHILQYVVLLKVTRTERRLGVAFFKACVCFIMSILLMKIDNTNGLICLFVYMFFISELGPLVKDALLSHAIVSEVTTRKMKLNADAFAEVLFPVASLALMYNKGWHALSFIILVISVLQFLVCALLALYPLGLPRDMISLQYQNLTEEGDDKNGRKIQNEIKKLLGGYTDPEASYVTSDEEVVFSMKKRQRVR